MKFVLYIVILLGVATAQSTAAFFDDDFFDRFDQEFSYVEGGIQSAQIENTISVTADTGGQQHSGSTGDASASATVTTVVNGEEHDSVSIIIETDESAEVSVDQKINATDDDSDISTMVTVNNEVVEKKNELVESASIVNTSEEKNNQVSIQLDEKEADRTLSKVEAESFIALVWTSLRSLFESVFKWF